MINYLNINKFAFQNWYLKEELPQRVYIAKFGEPLNSHPKKCGLNKFWVKTRLFYFLGISLLTTQFFGV